MNADEWCDLNDIATEHAQVRSRLAESIAEVEALKRELEVATEALEKIADPRKRDHKEPDAYTELGCVMNIAQVALGAIREGKCE